MVQADCLTYLPLTDSQMFFRHSPSFRFEVQGSHDPIDPHFILSLFCVLVLFDLICTWKLETCSFEESVYEDFILSL